MQLPFGVGLLQLENVVVATLLSRVLLGAQRRGQLWQGGERGEGREGREGREGVVDEGGREE